MTDRKQKSQIITFGCRLNRYESEVINHHTQQLDDVVVINTCAVTAEAERQAKQTIRRIHRTNPNARIVVTGCAAQLDPEKWSSIPGVHQVLGNEDKLRSENWTDSSIASGDRVSNIMAVRHTVAQIVTEFTGRNRAFVQVQQGCDHRCTFCVIPFGRGPSRSVTAEGVINQAQALVEKGYKEIVLTGVDVASWGKDFSDHPVLGKLCHLVLKAVPKLERLRLSSIDPVGIDEGLWELLANESRLMPHFHLSIQSGSNLILKRMKRRHQTEDVQKVIDRLRKIRPDIGLSADIITGFPTEDDQLFKETYQFLKQQALPYLHIFPYSERKGTPAARMPAVSVEIRKERAAILRALGKQIARDYHQSLVGQKVKILMESSTKGHSEQFAITELKEQNITPGEIVSAHVIQSNENGIIAEKI